MTKDEILNYFKDINHAYNESTRYDELKRMLDELTEPCEDAISRADAINALGYDISIESDRGLDEYKSVIKEVLCKIYDVQKANIEKLPPVTPKPKTGHWIWDYGYATCNQCGYTRDSKDNEGQDIPDNYCPNCGAQMKERGDENNGRISYL